MTQTQEPASAQPSSRDTDKASTRTTTIHNHITKETTNLDLSPVITALNSFMLSTRQCAYPQLIVTCRNQKRAFSRASLKEMGHRRATDLFVARFARPEDYIERPPGTGWFPSSGGKYSPAVEFLATFCRTDEVSGPMALDASGWANNIGNVRQLEVVLTKVGR